MRSLQNLAQDFIVLVPLAGDAYARRVFKFAYERPIAKPEGYDEEPRRSRAWWWVADRCSWRPMELSFSRVPVGTTASYHVELVAPENTDIVRGVFEAHVPAPSVSSREAVAGSAPRQPRTTQDAHDEIDDSNPRRGHLQLKTMPAQAYATARVQLRASPGGFLNPALGVTLAIAAIFWAGLDRVDNISEEDAAAAILLAVPTVLAAYIARPGEHELVAMMLSGIRAMVAASGLLLFAAAAAIAFGYKADGKLHDIWCYLRWPSLALAIGVAWSWIVVHHPLLPGKLRRRVPGRKRKKA